MSKKDLINEYIGILALIVIIILSVVGLYLYLNHQPINEQNDMKNTTISLSQCNKAPFFISYNEAKGQRALTNTPGLQSWSPRNKCKAPA
jgi:amino acid transporter